VLKESKMSDIGILGMGSYLPPKVRTNEFWGAGFIEKIEEKRNNDFLAIDRNSKGEKTAQVAPEIAAAMAALGNDPFFGAKKRHVIDDAAETSDMEAEAARRAMRNAKVTPDQIDLVMVHSLTPDLLMPSNAPAVQAKCELAHASAWSVDVSCSSFQAQLVNAWALIRSGVFRKILLVQSQAASRVIDLESAGSTAFGDAAAAVVVGEVPDGFGLRGHWLRTDGSLRDGVVITPVKDGVPQRRWDQSSAHAVFTSFDKDLGKVTGLQGTAYCEEACLGALSSAGAELKDVAMYIGNQSLGWFVDACRRRLALPSEKAFDTFQEVGGIGAVAVPFNMQRAAQAGRLQHGDLVLTYSPGAGFNRAALVYRWNSPGIAG
jgi:3-oxoacyl-[acyl-carrier-protein] synthase III